MIKIQRSFPAPASLALEAKKADGKYNLADVTNQLRKDFHDKCYICEIKPVQDPEVEHRLPHKNGKYADRKFDWENLFWSCGHCNSIKAQEKYDRGILDCCKEDPEDAIAFEVNEECATVSVLREGDEAAALTAELVNEVFNLKNTGARIAKCEVRTEQLQLEMDKLYYALSEFRTNPNSKLANKNMELLLRRSSAFAGFKRRFVRTHLAEYPSLKKYLT